MDIKRLLSLNVPNDKELIEMILSNRIDYYLGDKVGAAITIKKFGLLADDILLWHKYRIMKDIS